jgi:hypothetical protein
MQLGWIRLGAGGSPAFVQMLVDDLHADGLRSAGAAVACMWRDALLATFEERVVNGVRAALLHVDERSSHDLFDYGWHRELVCGEAARAVWASPLARARKIELFTEALGVRVAEQDDDSLRAPEVSPATPSSWFLMRTGLSRHHRRASIVGPEDLDDAERDVLRRLDRHRNWLTYGSNYPEAFGIVSFPPVIGRLLRLDSDALSPLQDGIWARRLVRWSRWKWLRSALDQTTYASPAREAAIETACDVVGAVSLDELIELSIAAAGEPDVPFEGLLDRLLARAGEPRSKEIRLLTPDEANRATERQRICRVALAAAFGSQAEYDDAIVAARTVRMTQTLRAAIQAALAARELSSRDL